MCYCRAVWLAAFDTLVKCSRLDSWTSHQGQNTCLLWTSYKMEIYQLNTKICYFIMSRPKFFFQVKAIDIPIAMKNGHHIWTNYITDDKILDIPNNKIIYLLYYSCKTLKIDLTCLTRKQLPQTICYASSLKYVYWYTSWIYHNFMTVLCWSDDWYVGKHIVLYQNISTRTNILYVLHGYIRDNKVKHGSQIIKQHH